MKSKKGMIKIAIFLLLLSLMSTAFTFLGYYIGSDKAPVIEYETIYEPVIEYETIGEGMVSFKDYEIESILSLKDKYSSFWVENWEIIGAKKEETEGLLGLTGILDTGDVIILVITIEKWVIWHEYVHAWDMLIYGEIYDKGEDLSNGRFEEIMDLSEAQTSYLAYLLLLKCEYGKDARILFDDMISRKDEYSYLQLLEDGKEEVDRIAKDELGL